MDFISNFAGSINKFESVLKPQLDRAGISSSAALILLCLFAGADITHIAKEQFLMELFTVGFCEVKEGTVAVTNKGAIVAKSLANTLNKNGL